jgi:predicted PurR-regulated permease PerM
MSDCTPTDNTAPKPRPVWLSPVAWIVTLVLVIYFFSPLSTVALGILAAAIIACTLQPLLKLVPGPRGLGVAVAGLSLVAILGLVGFSLSWPLHRPIADAIDNWPTTKLRIDEAINTWGTKIGLQEPPNVERLLEGLGNFLVGSGGQQLFSRGADVVFGLVVALAFTLAGSLFLLTEDPQTFVRPGLRLLDPRHRPGMQAVLTDLGPRFRRWVIGTLTGMFVVFSASAVGFWSIGLKFAVPLALLAGFAEVIPTIGPAIACVFLVVFAAAIQSGAKALAVLIVYGIIEALEAYIILPLIMRGAVNVPPAVTLFTVVLWGKIFGVPGLILAIPINLTIWSLLTQFRVRPREAEQMHSALQSTKAD